MIICNPFICVLRTGPRQTLTPFLVQNMYILKGRVPTFLENTFVLINLDKVFLSGSQDMYMTPMYAGMKGIWRWDAMKILPIRNTAWKYDIVHQLKPPNPFYL